MRHSIALAELTGLPRDASVPGATETEMGHRRAQLWELMCSADRLLSMIFNLPSVTRRLALSEAEPLVVAGTVQARVYLARLADITTKDRYFDNGHMTQESSAERWTAALELDRDIKVLASQVPRSWRSMHIEVLCIDKMVQIVHYYILVRVHLPIVVQQTPRDEFAYSYLTCTDACEAVARRYIDFRPLIPGIFFARILDLEAFTATVVLLLICYNPQLTATDGRPVLSKNRIEAVVAQVLEVMEDKRPEGYAGTKFTKNCASGVPSLLNLLQQSGPSTTGLKLKVPLLGNMSIRRNAASTQALDKSHTRDGWERSQGVSNQCQPSQTPVVQQQSSATTFDPAMSFSGSQQIRAGWQWGPLSWSIESHRTAGAGTFTTSLARKGLVAFSSRVTARSTSVPRSTAALQSETFTGRAYLARISDQHPSLKPFQGYPIIRNYTNSKLAMSMILVPNDRDQPPLPQETDNTSAEFIVEPGLVSVDAAPHHDRITPDKIVDNDTTEVGESVSSTAYIRAPTAGTNSGLGGWESSIRSCSGSVH
ncbi:hypothetical protein LTR24_009637 [Lithohypha guttulata]|uniref:Transcription factor domain-containing protein n=1 Tax=Lithohypha guttulata TaxID=1690604 RepID=A0ABR0JX56_9EURO|nr:hypothetical protein LTR24_009637 [Lithohypha guttulata]